MLVDVFLGAFAEAGEVVGTCDQAGEGIAEIGDQLFARGHGNGESGAFGNEFAGAAVIDDEGHKPEGHGFQDDPTAELAHGGEGEDLRTAEAIGHLRMIHPAGEFDLVGDAAVDGQLFQAGEFGAVADDVEGEAAFAAEGGGGFEEHVHALEGNEASYEGGAGGCRWRGRCPAREAIGVDGVLRDVDGLGMVLFREFTEGGAGGDEDGAGVASGGMEPRKRLVDVAEGVQPLTFRGPQFRVFLGPGNAAVERSQHEGNVQAGAAAGQRAGNDGRQRRDAVDEVELASGQACLELLPQPTFEDGIDEGGEGGIGGPTKGVAAAEHGADLPRAVLPEAVVDHFEVDAFAGAVGEAVLAIAFFGGEDGLADGGKGAAEGPADQGDGKALGVGSLGHEEDTRRTVVRHGAIGGWGFSGWGMWDSPDREDRDLPCGRFRCGRGCRRGSSRRKGFLSG